MKIATWNVNSLRARCNLVTDWLRREEPDVLCMQETKVSDADFPTEAFQRLGYAVMMAGEKSYNGVAIASRKLMRDVKIGLVGASSNDDKRLISAKIGGVRVFCCYVPNGKNLESDSYKQKLAWLAKLRQTLDDQSRADQDVVVCGDFNIARDERDLYDVEAFRGQTHFSPAEHQALNHVLDFGLQDSFRLFEDNGGLFTWWDYRGGSFRKNEGLRIDYVFVSQSLAARCSRVTHDVGERKKDKPSDHVPVVAEFADK